MPTVPDSGTAQQPLVDAGTQVGTPVATMGYGARESADAKRQAVDSTSAHDQPEDVNANSLIQKSQIITFDVLGKDFTASAKVAAMVEMANTDWREILKTQLYKK